MNPKRDILKETWHSFELLMTSKGFDNLKQNLESAIHKSPQIYVHVGAEGVIENKILRIGKAKNGAIDRWDKQSWGHKNTFLWSTGESRKYANYAEKYPNYLLFFAGMLELQTYLYVLPCQSVEIMNEIEKYLIKTYTPIWESYKKDIKMYFSNNHEIKRKASQYGIAKEIISSQRVETKPSIHNIIDVLHHAGIEQKEWLVKI